MTLWLYSETRPSHGLSGLQGRLLLFFIFTDQTYVFVRVIGALLA